MGVTFFSKKIDGLFSHRLWNWWHFLAVVSSPIPSSHVVYPVFFLNSATKSNFRSGVTPRRVSPGAVGPYPQWRHCFSLPKSDLKSSDFAVTRFLMKLSRTSHTKIIAECLRYFGFSLTRELIENNRISPVHSTRVHIPWKHCVKERHPHWKAKIRLLQHCAVISRRWSSV